MRADGDAAISLMAVDGTAIVGHVLRSPMSAPFRALGLAPLAVVPARQRETVGSALMKAAIATACADGWRGMLGDPDYNVRFDFSAVAVAPLASGEVGYAAAFAVL